MLSSYIIVAVLSALTFSLKFFFKKRTREVDYSCLDLYSGKTYFEICKKIGSPFLSEKQSPGLSGTWVLGDQRITLCFDDNLLFSSLLYFSRLPKAVKKLPNKKDARVI